MQGGQIGGKLNPFTVELQMTLVPKQERWLWSTEKPLESCVKFFLGVLGTMQSAVTNTTDTWAHAGGGRTPYLLSAFCLLLPRDGFALLRGGPFLHAGSVPGSLDVTPGAVGWES